MQALTALIRTTDFGLLQHMPQRRCTANGAAHEGCPLEVERIEHQALARAPDDAKPRALCHWLEDALIPRFGSRLLEIDLPVTRTRGTLTAQVRSSGAVVGAVDMLLAATAITHGPRRLRRMPNRN